RVVRSPRPVSRRRPLVAGARRFAASATRLADGVTPLELLNPAGNRRMIRLGGVPASSFEPRRAGGLGGATSFGVTGSRAVGDEGGRMYRSRWLLAAVVAATGAFLAVPGATQVSRATICTTAEQAAAAGKLAAFRTSMTARRKAFYRRHRGAAARRKFSKR